MSGFDYHGWSCGAVSKRKIPSRILLILTAGMLLSGCSRNYDSWGRPVIIDASRRQGGEETIVARRSDVQSSNQTAPNGPYRVGQSENPVAYGQQNQFSGPTNPMGPGRQTVSPYPIGNPQQAYTYPHSYASRQDPSLSQGHPAVNPNAATIEGRQNINDDRRQSPPAGNYPPTRTGTNHLPPSGIGQNPSQVISLNPSASYGRSTNGMPEVSGVQVTEVPPSAAVGTQTIGTNTNPIAPSTPVETTRVEPGTSNGGFSSNTTPGAPSFRVPNPSGNQADLLQPAVSVHAAGYSPDRIGLVNAITELERYQGTNHFDLHASLALHYLYLTQQQPEKANRFLPENEEQANRTLELLDYVRDQVAPRADFVISCMKICDKVVSFGNYQEIKPAKLQSGELQKVYVYCELENFQSKRDVEGRYLSDIYIDIALYDSRFYPQCQKSVPVNDTPSYSRRQDFFLIGDLTIPKLSPGKYLLRVEVEDRIAHKKAKPKEIVFEVKAPTTAAR